jgi:anti-sigma-K factor RskA
MRMNADHTTFQENLAAYALGALDPQEAAALERHLKTCEPCRLELATYERVGAGLLTALPPHAPRPAVKRGLQKRLAGITSRPRPQLNLSPAQWLVSGLLAALVVLNALLVSQVYTLRQEQAEIAAQHKSDQTALAMLAYPSTRSLAFDQNGVVGSLLVDEQRNLVGVFAWNLPQPTGGQTYEVWLIDKQGQRTRAGFLVPEAGYPFVSTVVWSPQPLSNYTGIGVTVEPTGGSAQPTGRRILRVDF